MDRGVISTAANQIQRERDRRARGLHQFVAALAHAENIAKPARFFLGLSKTCAKLGFAFWDYLGSRLAVPNQPRSHTCEQSSGIVVLPPDRPTFPRLLEDRNRGKFPGELGMKGPKL